MSYLVVDFILELVSYLFAFSWCDRFGVFFKSGKLFRMSLLGTSMASAACVVACFVERRHELHISISAMFDCHALLLSYFLANKMPILCDGFLSNVSGFLFLLKQILTFISDFVNIYGLRHCFYNEFHIFVDNTTWLFNFALYRKPRESICWIFSLFLLFYLEVKLL